MGKSILVAAFILTANVSLLMAQTAIHDATITGPATNPHSSAVLDVKSTNKGVLVPNVDIVDLATAAPVTTPAEGLLVYNTNSGTGVGYYYWSGLSWVKLMSGNTTPLIGTGTADYLARWTSATNLGIGTTRDNGTNVGFGIAPSASYRARVAGNILIDGSGSTIAGSNLANASLLVGTSTVGIGMDPNELYFKGTDGNFGVLGANNLNINVNGSTRMSLLSSGVIRLNSYTTNGIVRTTAGNGTLTSGGPIDLTSEVTGTLPVGNLPSLAGDVTGALNANTVGRIQGRDVAATAPTNNQVLKWNDASSAWIPAADNNTTYSVMGVTEGITGTATNARSMSAVNTKQIIETLAPNVTLAGENYLSLTGQQITANPVNLASSNVTGVLSISNGGTGSSTQGWVDLTTDQTAAGIKTWSSQANFGNVLRASNGTAAAPAYSFTNSTNMGMYRAGSTDLRMITGGDWRVIIRSDYVRFRSLVHNANGTAVAPSYTFNSSPGTGMWRPGGDILALSTAGAERLRVIANGNVGIGAITAPATLLHMGSLSDATTASQILTVESMGFAGLHLIGDRGGSSGEPGGAFVRLSQDVLAVQGIFGVVNVAGQDGSGAALSGTEGNSVVLGNKYSGTLHLATNNAVRMSIASNGTARLHTYTSNGLLKTTSGNGTLAIATGADLPSGSGNYIQNQTASAQSANYYISGYGRANDFRASNGTAAAPTYRFASDTDIGMYRATTNTLAFSTTAIERMRIASNGNVGIGTTTPASKLHVGGIGSGNGILIGNYNDQLGWNGTGGMPFFALRFAGYRDVVSNFTGAMISGTRTNLCCSGLSQGMELDFWVQPNTATVSGDGNLINTARVFGSGVAAVDYWGLSDKRIKSEIVPIAYGLDEIVKLEPLNYKQKVTKGFRESQGYVEGEMVESFGFVAQDLYQVIPELVNVPEDPDSYWTVNYSKLTPVLVKAIQEQQKLIEGQQSLIDELIGRIDALESKR